MRVAHRKTWWMHSALTVVLCTVLLVLLLVNPTPSMLLIVSFLVVYLLGHTILHAKRSDLNKETVLEYGLIAAAVFIVLSGALTS